MAKDDESAALRDRLLAELKGIACADEVALWAKRSLGEKNSLTDQDAQSIEDAFGVKLASLAVHEGPDIGKFADEVGNGVRQLGEGLPAADGAGKDQETAQHLQALMPKLAPIGITADGGKETVLHLPALPSESKSKPKPRSRTNHLSLRPIDGDVSPGPTAGANANRRQNNVDKSVLPLPEPRRVRDSEHVKYVAQQPCLVCGRTPCDPATFASPRAARWAAR